MKCQICICWKAPAVPRTRGAPVLLALGPVVLYAASVKLDEVSNTPLPRPSHQGPGAARFIGVAIAEAAERAAASAVRASMSKTSRKRRGEVGREGGDGRVLVSTHRSVVSLYIGGHDGAQSERPEVGSVELSHITHQRPRPEPSSIGNDCQGLDGGRSPKVRCGCAPEGLVTSISGRQADVHTSLIGQHGATRCELKVTSGRPGNKGGHMRGFDSNKGSSPPSVDQVSDQVQVV